MAIKNKVQLITYPDSLGGDLNALNKVLETHFPGMFEAGVHVLPPFPSSGDRGFAPINYFEIEPAFGNWQDISELAEKQEVMLDLMVNHVSRQSVFFQDYLEKGAQSKYADMFIPLEKLWKDGKPNEDDIAKIFLRRKKPYSTYAVGPNQKEVQVWTTFGKEDPSEQIDIDINTAMAKEVLGSVLEHFAKQRVKIVRLDAVGYLIKKMGTSCFFVEPEIYEFFDWVAEKAKSLDLEILPEVHAHYSIQNKLAERGFWIYDFILPYRILEALLMKTSGNLLEYLKNRPEKQFTMLDCHDGIPVKPDMDTLVKSSEAREIVDMCLERGANLSLIHSDKHKDEDGFDVHQIRCSYYSVLNSNDDAYIAARAIQFFVPGIPQVYYVGLLAGENDIDKVKETGEGREINRHNFTFDEIDEAVQKPVVVRLKKLILFRNGHPAFDGNFTVHQTESKELKLSWKNAGASCSLHINLDTFTSTIEFTNQTNELEIHSI